MAASSVYKVGQLRYAYSPSMHYMDPVPGFFDPNTGQPAMKVEIEEATSDESVFQDSILKFNTGEQLQAGTYYYFRFKVRQLSTKQDFAVRLVTTQTSEDDDTSELIQEVETYSVAAGSGANIFELILAPDNPVDKIRFYLTRILDDYQTARVMQIEILDLAIVNNIIPVSSSTQKTLSLSKIGFQSAPGTLLCVNGEQIRVGRSGTYEINHGINVTFFGIAHGEDIPQVAISLSDGVETYITVPDQLPNDFLSTNLRLAIERSLSNIRSHGTGYANSRIEGFYTTQIDPETGDETEVIDNTRMNAAVYAISSAIVENQTNYCMSIITCLDDNYSTTDGVCLIKVIVYKNITPGLTFSFIYNAARSIIEPNDTGLVEAKVYKLYARENSNVGFNVLSQNVAIVQDGVMIEYGPGMNRYYNNLGLLDVDDEFTITDYTGEGTNPFIFDYSWEE